MVAYLCTCCKSTTSKTDRDQQPIVLVTKVSLSYKSNIANFAFCKSCTDFQENKSISLLIGYSKRYHRYLDFLIMNFGHNRFSMKTFCFCFYLFVFAFINRFLLLQNELCLRALARFVQLEIEY